MYRREDCQEAGAAVAGKSAEAKGCGLVEATESEGYRLAEAWLLKCARRFEGCRAVAAKLGQRRLSSGGHMSRNIFKELTLACFECNEAGLNLREASFLLLQKSPRSESFGH